MVTADLPDKDTAPIEPLAALFSGKFSIDWIAELTPRKPSEILAAMEQGVDQHWLEKHGPGLFSFSDEKKRTFFLEYWSGEEKQHLHKKIAQLLVKMLPDGSERALLVESHLLQIDNDEETCELLIRAGDIHRKQFRHDEALAAYIKVLGDLDQVSGEKADNIFAHAAINYSKLVMAKHETPKVLEILGKAYCRAEKCNNLAFQAQLKMQLGKNRWLCSQFESAQEHFEEAWSLAQDAGKPELLRSVTVFKAFSLIWQGRFREAVQVYDGISSDVEHYLKGSFPLYATQTMGYCYTQVGEIAQGIAMLQNVRKYCLERRELFVASHAAMTIGNAFLDIKQVKSAIKYLEISLGEAKATGNDWTAMWSYLLLSYAYYLNGESKKAHRYLVEYLSHRNRSKVTTQIYPHRLKMFWAIESGKLPPIPGTSFVDALETMLETKNIFVRGIAYRYQALLGQRKGLGSPAIVDLLKSSLQCLEISGHKIETAKTQLQLAHQYLLQGDGEKAKDLTRQGTAVLSSYNEELIPVHLRSLTKDSDWTGICFKDILEFGTKIASKGYNRGCLEQALSSVSRAVGAERGAVFILDGPLWSSQLRIEASRNLTKREFDDAAFEPALKIINNVVRYGRSHFGDIGSSGSVGACVADPNQCCVCSPIVLRDKTFGAIYFDNHFFGLVFKKADQALLESFAAQIALALAHTRTGSGTEIPTPRVARNEAKHLPPKASNRSDSVMIGESPAIKNVFYQLKKIAFTDTPVLILGETGVGKELVAREIHRQSLRHDNPFVPLFCGSLPESIIASSLFGHEAGAFTGATKRSIGHIELADKGTLFLDELGDIPLNVQLHLLRVLESKEFHRLGGRAVVRSDFRLVAATNCDLEEAVKNNQFRKDLYYRINVFPILIPPLRERLEDIPLLAHYFLELFSLKIGKTFASIPDREMEKLTVHNWPGNIRELKNAIERSAIISQEPHFVLEDRMTAGLTAASLQRGFPTLEQSERSHILRAVQKTKWKIRGPGGAAELLDIRPSTLQSKMKKLGISRPDYLRRRKR